MSAPHGTPTTTAEISVGSRNQSNRPGTWTEPCQTPILGSITQVAAVRAHHTSNARSIPCGMAGGVARKGDGRTLDERIHGTLEPENVAPPIKPCWVGLWI